MGPIIKYLGYESMHLYSVNLEMYAQNPPVYILYTANILIVDNTTFRCILFPMYICSLNAFLLLMKYW